MSTTLATLIATCAPLVHPTTLTALIQVESAANPYAVSLNRPTQLEDAGLDQDALIPHQPTSAREAISVTRTLLQQGLTTSVGLSQINIEHLPRLHLKIADLFDPCTNLRIAQAILIDCAGRNTHGSAGFIAASVRRTLSCYNTGNATAGLTNGYVQRIHRTALRIVRTPLLARR
jgi:type IV secretion system protein VirB1